MFETEVKTEKNTLNNGIENLPDQEVVNTSTTTGDTNKAPIIDSVQQVIKHNPIKTTIKRPFKCLQCVCRYMNQENLDIHMKIHESGELKCDICNKTFKKPAALIAHKSTHDHDRPFKCNICDVRCKHRGALKEHLKLHKKLVFKCTICGKDFNNINNCKLHEKRHTGAHNKKTKCHICDKEFAQKCLLSYHMRTHTGERPNVCEHCGAAFACKSNLTKHYRIHTGERPFKCDICHKGFNQKSSLTCHKRTHVTYRPFACKICNKQFGLNEELIVHMRVHGERKLFECNMCDMEFTEHCYLKSHYRMHTEYVQTTKKPWVYDVNVDLEDRNNYLKDGEEPLLLEEITVTEITPKKRKYIRRINQTANEPPKNRKSTKRTKKIPVYKDSDSDTADSIHSAFAVDEYHMDADLNYASDVSEIIEKVPANHIRESNEKIKLPESQLAPLTLNSNEAVIEVVEPKTEPKIEIKCDDEMQHIPTPIELVSITIKEELHYDEDVEPSSVTLEQIDWKKWLEERFSKQVNS